MARIIARIALKTEAQPFMPQDPGSVIATDSRMLPAASLGWFGRYARTGEETIEGAFDRIEGYFPQ
jgi:hypothetical protein